jgi:hypothetical protein
VGQAATIKHIVVETDICFDKDENTKQYNKYLQACISANRSRSNAVLLHPTCVKQRLRYLQFYDHLLFGFEKVNSLWVRELIYSTKSFVKTDHSCGANLCGIDVTVKLHRCKLYCLLFVS